MAGTGGSSASPHHLGMGYLVCPRAQRWLVSSDLSFAEPLVWGWKLVMEP